MGAILMVIAAFVCVVLSTAWSGYVLSVLWGWFLVPYLHVPSISVPVAIGLSMTVSMVTHQRTKDESFDLGESLIYWSLTPLLFLFSGWIVTKFL